jgi:hypothetical protein
MVSRQIAHFGGRGELYIPTANVGSNNRFDSLQIEYISHFGLFSFNEKLINKMKRHHANCNDKLSALWAFSSFRRGEI